MFARIGALIPDIESGGITLAPGSKEQNTCYIGETFPVKDVVTNATSQIRLQGRLRIVASDYFKCVRTVSCPD